MSFSKCFDYGVKYCCESWAHQQNLEEPEESLVFHQDPPPFITSQWATTTLCFKAISGVACIFFQTKDNFTQTSNCSQIKWSTFTFWFWSASQPTPTLRVYTCYTTGGLLHWRPLHSHCVCSGSVVVTAYDFESGRPGSSPEWGLIYY